VINIQELLNRARPEQARCNLEAEMRRRVEKRRVDVMQIRQVLKGSRERVKQLRDAAAAAAAGKQEMKRISDPAVVKEAKVKRVKIETAAESEGTNGVREARQDMEVD
jgi:anti-sigma-K factor RskA